MELINRTWDLLRSPRFVAFYWSTGITASLGFLALVTDVLPDLGMPELATALSVALIAQLTKAINNFKQNRPMGFVKDRKRY